MSPTDAELERRLRQLVTHADPVPAVVVQAGRAALGWRRLDAELAELLGDSALDSAAPALTRSAGAALRSVTFATAQRTIDLEIVEHGAGWRLRGQLSPAMEARVEVQRVDGQILAATRSDGLGRFLAEVGSGGTVRLRVTGDAGAGAGADAIETAWVGL
jgi:hypothetical protein